MFGQNKILKQELGDGQELFVKEIFPTIQGEGPLAGTRAIFIRVGGCNLACFACDTDFDIGPSDKAISLEKIVNEVYACSLTNLPLYSQLVVITGGEPFRQNIVPLIQRLLEMNFRVQIETAGTIWIPEMSRFAREMMAAVPKLMIICSPKTGKLNADIVEYIHSYKYIIRDGETSSTDGLPVFSTQVKGKEQEIARPTRMTPTAHIYIQPWDDKDEAQNAKNTFECVRVCLQYGYRLSLQLHKYLNLP